MQIERLREDDQRLKDLASMYVKTFAQEPWLEDLDQDQVKRYMAESNKGQSRVYMGLVDGKPLAMAIVLDVVSYGINYYRIEDICVDSSHQGQGLGSQFLKGLEDEIIDDRHDVILLSTIRQFPARGFYEKNGYTIMEASVNMFKDFHIK